MNKNNNNKNKNEIMNNYVDNKNQSQEISKSNNEIEENEKEDNISNNISVQKCHSYLYESLTEKSSISACPNSEGNDRLHKIYVLLQQQNNDQEQEYEVEENENFQYEREHDQNNIRPKNFNDIEKEKKCENNSEHFNENILKEVNIDNTKEDKEEYKDSNNFEDEPRNADSYPNNKKSDDNFFRDLNNINDTGQDPVKSIDNKVLKDLNEGNSSLKEENENCPDFMNYEDMNDEDDKEKDEIIYEEFEDENIESKEEIKDNESNLNEGKSTSYKNEIIHDLNEIQSNKNSEKHSDVDENMTNLENFQNSEQSREENGNQEQEQEGIISIPIYISCVNIRVKRKDWSTMQEEPISIKRIINKHCTCIRPGIMLEVNLTRRIHLMAMYSHSICLCDKLYDKQNGKIVYDKGYYAHWITTGVLFGNYFKNPKVKTCIH